ncbi:MAG TPA: dicarboxylate transporter/tellurite-resistance protein TehA [Stellaceae bacterium]|nr:dicarboxylate transporter/tellurite-resistance protein TehA [Stellaceae bacterium]
MTTLLENDYHDRASTMKPSTAKRRFVPPIVPAGFFGIVLGLAGLGNGWRVAHQIWHLPAVVGEVFEALGAAVWAVLVILLALKWIFVREEALAEAHHPVQSPFIGLAGVATMLVALAAQPYSYDLAFALFLVGALFAGFFGIWVTGMFWRGDRDSATTTPVLYLPTVGAGFVAATTASALGFPDWGALSFGVAAFSWVAIDSVLMQRFYNVPSMAPALRPTLGIQLAPPVVGLTAYLGINGGHPDLFAHALLGYGILMAAILLRKLRWIMEQPFVAGYWGFTFGVTSITTGTLRMVAGGGHGAVATLAPLIFIATNVTMAVIILATLRLIFQGRLVPAPLAYKVS